MEKIFCDPFAADPSYYKSKSYDDVFRAVRKDINNNDYTWTKPAEGIRLREDADLTSTLKAFVPYCPDLFKSDSPDARKLVAHFGELIQKSYYGQSHRERQTAKKAIKDILNNPHPYAKNQKKHIPPLLSLNDLCAYVHEITKSLKKHYQRYCDNDVPKRMTPELKDALKNDRRLIVIVERRLLKILINKPKELTIKLVADFIGRTPKGLKQKLKEEKRHSNACHLEW